MNVNNYEGMNISPGIEDELVKFLEQLKTTSNVSAVLFTGIGTRIRELHNRGLEAFPVEGKYWACVDDFLCGNRPEYAGRIDADKAGELGLFDPRRPIVKIYSDGFFFS